MSAKDDGGPAFPRPVGWNGAEYHEPAHCSSDQQDGMSLRDYFAAMCIVGNFNWAANENDDMLTAKAAYRLADAMLKARGT